MRIQVIWKMKIGMHLSFRPMKNIISLRNISLANYDDKVNEMDVN